MPPPGVITGGIQPLLEGHTARPLRYTPIDGEFVIRNGSEFFNRPLYGPSSPTQSGDFRVDAGDLPEFSLYLPGHGGNLKLGFIAPSGSKWAATANEIVTRYRPGRMIYEIRDPLLAKGTLLVELLTAGEGHGFLLKAEGRDLPANARLAWAFGGVSGKKGKRNGDIGCEVEPVSRFFQLRAEECDGNRFEIALDDPATKRPFSRLTGKAADLLLTFPPGSQLSQQEFAAWTDLPSANTVSTAAPRQPVLFGSAALQATPLYLTLNHLLPSDDPTELKQADPASVFDTRSKQVAAIAATLTIASPDPYLDASAPALAIAAETIWDARQECVLHGGVAWRTMLAGWRGPYSLDALGNHDRAVLQFRHWLKRQNVSAIDTATPATGPADSKIHLARKEAMLHTNGDLSNNHYDMNLVFFDVLLRHLRWTGDLDFAREIWPAFQRHLAWEQRLFRRTYLGASGSELPLYEAYAAIWASDNLQYNGGGAAHSSAYNIFAFRAAAQIARLLGEDPAPYEAEAQLVHQAMQELLWLPAQGAFAESKDILGPQTAYANPALWTLYHTVDSEVPAPRQSWQMAAERLATLRRIPVHGEGVPAGDWYMLACSDWLPYLWSLTLLVLAENIHTALALWQAGMADEAYRLFKGNLLDSMYMGLCPGDFHMSSALDVHRQEAQRDFGDPIGIASRALIEGLFGIQPNLLAKQIAIRPGFPSDWDRASVKHKDFDFTWHREGASPSETYEFTSRLASEVPLTLVLPARTTSLPNVTSDGTKVECAFDPSAVGNPSLTIKLPAARSYRVAIRWHGNAPAQIPSHRSYRTGQALVLPPGAALAQIDDPQNCLDNGHIAASGLHTVFANIQQADCAWSLPISFDAQPEKPAFLPVPIVVPAAHIEPLDLSSILKHQVTEVFTRGYTEPRSPFCSLSVPDTGMGGWANVDEPPKIDDTGLRSSAGELKTPLGIPFRTPEGTAPNCLFLSYWKQDETAATIPLTGRAKGIYLLMAGTTLPQCSRMEHALVTAAYADKSEATLSLRNPETWWPIEQDYLLDDYLFVNRAPLPPRVDLRTGQTRLLDPTTFQGKGRSVRGGAATVLHLPLDPAKDLKSLKIEVELYGVVVGLLGATLVRA